VEITIIVLERQRRDFMDGEAGEVDMSWNGWHTIPGSDKPSWFHDNAQHWLDGIGVTGVCSGAVSGALHQMCQGPWSSGCWQPLMTYPPRRWWWCSP